MHHLPSLYLFAMILLGLGQTTKIIRTHRRAFAKARVPSKKFK